MNNCTRCGNFLNEMKVKIYQLIEVQRKKNNDVWEILPNLNLSTQEILCEKCFDLYCEAITGKMNIKYKKDDSNEHTV